MQKELIEIIRAENGVEDEYSPRKQKLKAQETKMMEQNIKDLKAKGKRKLTAEELFRVLA